MAARQLAKRLGEYGIRSQSVRINGATPKGFYRTQFDDAFARYLSAGIIAPESAIPQQQPENQTISYGHAVADGDGGGHGSSGGDNSHGGHEGDAEDMLAIYGDGWVETARP